MAENSHISWTDHTFNPWIGCTKVSPGCVNCYAETLMDHRYGKVKWGKGQPRKRTQTWRDPVKWNKQAGLNAEHVAQDRAAYESAFGPYRRPRVFCASLADWLDDEVPIEWLADLLALIHATPHLDWLLLTKRPENWRGRICWAGDHLLTTGRVRLYDALVCPWIGLTPTAPNNVWIGTTVEDQTRAEERIPHLVSIPARVRFLSCEPLLGPLRLDTPMPGPDLDQGGGNKICQPWFIQCGIHWVICGGESGPGARPMHPDWARSLRDQCQAAGVPFHFKQWGEWAVRCGGLFNQRDFASEDPRCERWPCVKLSYNGRNATTDPEADNDTIYMQKVGKLASGRNLGGREWNEFPALERRAS